MVFTYILWADLGAALIRWSAGSLKSTLSLRLKSRRSVVLRCLQSKHQGQVAADTPVDSAQ